MGFSSGDANKKHHRYLNITSDMLRNTWIYGNFLMGVHCSRLWRRLCVIYRPNYGSKTSENQHLLIFVFSHIPVAGPYYDFLFFLDEMKLCANVINIKGFNAADKGKQFMSDWNLSCNLLSVEDICSLNFKNHFSCCCSLSVFPNNSCCRQENLLLWFKGCIKKCRFQTLNTILCRYSVLKTRLQMRVPL